VQYEIVAASYHGERIDLHRLDLPQGLAGAGQPGGPPPRPHTLAAQHETTPRPLGHRESHAHSLAAAAAIVDPRAAAIPLSANPIPGTEQGEVEYAITSEQWIVRQPQDENDYR